MMNLKFLKHIFFYIFFWENLLNYYLNLLLLEKGACDLYMHGAIEASDEQVFNSFSSALSQSLQLQNQISMQKSTL